MRVCGIATELLKVRAVFHVLVLALKCAVDADDAPVIEAEIGEGVRDCETSA